MFLLGKLLLLAVSAVIYFPRCALMLCWLSCVSFLECIPKPKTAFLWTNMTSGRITECTIQTTCKKSCSYRVIRFLNNSEQSTDTPKWEGINADGSSRNESLLMKWDTVGSHSRHFNKLLHDTILARKRRTHKQCPFLFLTLCNSYQIQHFDWNIRRSPLNPVLGKNPVLKTEINGRGDPLRWPRDTL
jgi:hypothetical protein